ncbi:MAG: hypothetical protein J1F64_10480 [Oscillospiraceae bacterium]|nr:hypothetical protein [Oscillospiraceae bacterium]
MEPKDFIVVRINGDYAMVKDTADPECEEFPIAMALLPDGVDEGRKIHCEMFEYTLID